MRGFGEPSQQQEGKVFGDFNTTRPYAWGFGDPSTGVDYAEQPDAGFGDVVPESILQVLQMPTRDLPDDGGIIVTLVGQFPDLGNQKGVQGAGPFLVTLVDAHTGEKYPKDMVGCHSGLIGKGNQCTTDLRHEKLRFVLPPLPLSEYSIEIRYGDNFRQTISFPNAFRVVHRTREIETYGARSNLSTVFNAGPRLEQMEKLRGE